MNGVGPREFILRMALWNRLSLSSLHWSQLGIHRVDLNWSKSSEPKPRDPWTTLLCRQCSRAFFKTASAASAASDCRQCKTQTFSVFHSFSLCGPLATATLHSGLSASLKNSLLSAYVYIPQKIFKCSKAISFHGTDGLQAWGERTCSLIGSLLRMFSLY